MPFAVAAVIDAVLVVVFVAIGRNNHAEGVAATGVLGTAAPFLIALVVGWVTARAWKRPATPQTGVIVWLVTVTAGLVLRRLLFDRGTALAFVIVATLFNLATIVGWRLLHTRARRAASPGT